MNQPTSPQALSSSDFRSILGMNELADLGTKLFDPSHITAVQGSVQKSLEHTCDLSVYAKSELPVAVKCFSQNGASAFDHGTIQDLKHHKVAHETYLLLRGRLRILWKRPRDAHFTRAIRLSSRKPWAIIPAKHCLLVAGNNGGEFLAVAFKTKPSNQKNKGKQLGAACTWAKRCGMAKHCELLCKNRSDFFDTIKDEREKAVGRVQAFV